MASRLGAVSEHSADAGMGQWVAASRRSLGDGECAVDD